MRIFNNKDVYVISNGLTLETDNKNGSEGTTFEAALRVVGFGKIQIFILFVSGLVLMAAITETMGMSIIMPAAQCDLELTSSRKGIVSSISIVGILVSSQFWGYLADTRGRRKIIMYALFVSNICTVCSSFVNNFPLFVIWRFLCGLFISGSAATIYAYLGEFNSTKNRATVIGWASLSIAIANLYLPLSGWLILPPAWSLEIYDGFSYRPWRLLLIVNAIPGLIAALCLLYLPESPKFLLAQGMPDKALDILKWSYRVNKGTSDENFPIVKLLPETDSPDVNGRETNGKKCAVLKSFCDQIVNLYRKPIGFNFTICCLLLFGVFFVSAGMGLWYPYIQNQLSASESSESGTVCQILDLSLHPKIDENNNSTNSTNSEPMKACDDTVNIKTFLDTLVLGVFYVVGYSSYSLLIKPLGRGVILITSLTLSGAAGLSLQWITQPNAIVILFCSHLMFAGICVSITNGAVVDLIPTHLRGMAVSVALMFGRLGSIVGSSAVGLLLDVNCTATFYLYSSFIIGCALLASLLPCR